MSSKPTVQNQSDTATDTTTQTETKTKITSVVLWIVQGLLAALFLFAGGMKLAMAGDTLAAQSPLPLPLALAFMRFIGVAEVLGALGLILPGLLRIATGLTPLAAAGLVLIMIGATVLSWTGAGLVAAVLPLVTGLLCASVIYGRLRLAPLGATTNPSRLQPAA